MGLWQKASGRREKPLAPVLGRRKIVGDGLVASLNHGTLLTDAHARRPRGFGRHRPSFR